MGKYTIEIREIVEGGGELFPYQYDFYDEELKEKFEEKFIDHFYFHEIGFETIQRFTHSLASKLNMIAPYYNELYKTELASKEINFLLNKDLKETFTRELDNVSNIKSNTKNSDLIETMNKESSVENGNASVSLEIKDLTSVSNNSAKNNTNLEAENMGNNKISESTTLISQGNIGVTTSATLLADWRNVLINIDKLIFEELSDLFMLIY